MGGALAPNSPARPRLGSSRTSFIPRYFRRTPRYYRLGHGSVGRRLAPCVEHAVVAHRDNGKQMFNFPNGWGREHVVLSNTYHRTTDAVSLQQRAGGLQHPCRHGF